MFIDTTDPDDWYAYVLKEHIIETRIRNYVCTLDESAPTCMMQRVQNEMFRAALCRQIRCAWLQAE